MSLIPLLLRRLEANTLLPGSLREEELDYEAHAQAAGKKAKNTAVPPAAMLRVEASTIGYQTLICAIFRSLDFLKQPFWPHHERKMVESFVLQGLNVIPRTAGIPASLGGCDDRVVIAIEKYMSPLDYDPTFYVDAALLRTWRSGAVSSVLRARGALQTGVATSEQNNAEFDAQQRADIAKHGLRDCALPFCAKTEKTVKEFAGCSGCRSVVYCCLEHQALDWRAHKKACREREAARLAAEEAAEGGFAA